MATISTRAVDVLGELALGFLGGRVSSRPGDRTDTLLNSAPQSKQVSTLTVSTAANLTKYSAQIDGNAFSFTSDGTATKAEVAAGLLVALKTSPAAYGVVTAVSDGVDTLTITARIAGRPFVLSQADANLADATSAGSAADAVPFGRAVIETSRQGHNVLGGLAKSASMSAQVDTLTTTYVASVNYQWSIVLDGKVFTDTVAANTNTAATLTDIIASINAAMPAQSVVATTSATVISLTAEVAGIEFSANLTADDKGASVPAVTLTSNKGLATSLVRAFRGASLRRADIAPDASGVAQYRSNEGVEALSVGQVYVSASAAAGSDVYVELASGTTSGMFYSSDSATRVKLPSARFVRSDATSGLAVLELGL